MQYLKSMSESVCIIYKQWRTSCILSNRCSTIWVLSIFIQTSDITWWIAVWVSCQLIYHFGPDKNIPRTIGWVAMKFCTDSYDPQRLNYKDFGDPLVLASPWTWYFCFFLRYLDSYTMDRLDICHRVHCDDFGAPLTSNLAPSPVQTFN